MWGRARRALCVVWRFEPADEQFCGGCGARLTTEARASAVSTPGGEPGPAPPAGERRQLTVLFCDLVGSTPLSQQLDAEEWRDLIAQYQQAASGAVGRFGGHVARKLGDGLLIYFGWPTAREDDPERAVRAGLAIVDGMGPLNTILAAGDGLRLAVRIGLHTGPVVIAVGGEVFGETANVAARVQGAAEPDTVVITAATQRLVAGMFVVEDCGPQMLKGVREPVTLYRVVQASGVRSRLAVAAGRLTRFVGREVELATLIDRWARAQDGEGQNVVVLGEAGIGKSRLVYQFHERLTGVPHTWLECGATPYTEGTPFHPVIALVSQGLTFAPGDTAAEQLGKLEVGLSRPRGAMRKRRPSRHSDGYRQRIARGARYRGGVSRASFSRIAATTNAWIVMSASMQWWANGRYTSSSSRKLIRLPLRPFAGAIGRPRRRHLILQLTVSH